MKNFICNPPGLSIGLSIEPEKVCHLRHALYGLKQVPWAWFTKFSSTISRLDYIANYYDSALFLCRINKDTILLLQYMDEMIIIDDALNGIQELKDFLSQQFEMKGFGHLNYFLSLEITHCTDRLYITQAKYTSELLSWVKLTDDKTIDTPIELNAQLISSGGKPLSNLSYCHSSKHFLCCSPSELVFVCSTIDSLYCYPAFLDTWRTLSFMAFSILLSLLLFSMHSLILCVLLGFFKIIDFF